MDCDMIENTTASQGGTPKKKPAKVSEQKENIQNRDFHSEIMIINLDTGNEMHRETFDTLNLKINNTFMDSYQNITDWDNSHEDCSLSAFINNASNTIDDQHHRRGRAERSLNSINLEREQRSKTEHSFYSDMLEDSPEVEKNRPQRTILSNERTNTKYFQKITKNHKSRQNLTNYGSKPNVFEFTLGKKRTPPEPRVPAIERFNKVLKRLKIKVKFEDSEIKKTQFGLSTKLFDELSDEKQRNYDDFSIKHYESQTSIKLLNNLACTRTEENKLIRSIRNIKYSCNELNKSQLLSLKEEIESK